MSKFWTVMNSKEYAERLKGDRIDFLSDEHSRMTVPHIINNADCSSQRVAVDDWIVGAAVSNVPDEFVQIYQRQRKQLEIMHEAIGRLLHGAS